MKSIYQFIKLDEQVIFDKCFEVEDEFEDLLKYNMCYSNEGSSYEFENKEVAEIFVKEFIEGVLPKAKNLVLFEFYIRKEKNGEKYIIDFNVAYTKEDSIWDDEVEVGEDNFAVNFGGLLDKYNLLDEYWV